MGVGDCKCVCARFHLFSLGEELSKDLLITPAKWRLQCDTLGCRESMLSVNVIFFSSEVIGKPPACLISALFASLFTVIPTTVLVT